MKKIIDYFNKRIKLFTIFDVKLAQIVSALLMIVIIKLFPKILKINFVWLVTSIVSLSSRLFYVVFLKTEKIE